MYFPVIRGKQYELQALLAVAGELIAARNVLPIIEPVRNEWLRINRILDAGLEIGLIINPEHGIYSQPSGRSRRAQMALPATAATTFARPEITPTLLVRGNMPIATINSFHAHFGTRPHFIYVSSAPPNPAIMSAALAHTPTGILIARQAVAPVPPRHRNVDILDGYVRQERNADYPLDEFFSDRLVTINADTDYASFGDYSIVGRNFAEGGGQANNVALHLIYSTAGPRTALRIRHYVSAPHPNLPTMCREALNLLVADLPALIAMTPLNETITVRELRVLHAQGGHLALGKAKEMAIRHHLELMTVVQ